MFCKQFGYIFGKLKMQYTILLKRTYLVAQTVKHLPTVQEIRVQSLGKEDPLEKEMATHSRTVAWKIPWTEEPGRLQSIGSQRVGHEWVTSLSYSQRGLPRWRYWKRNCLPVQEMQETQVWSLGREDDLEEGMATPSSILAWGIPWTEEPGRLQFIGSHRVRHDWSKHTRY